VNPDHVSRPRALLRHPRPSIDPFDKLFWVIARRVWSDWKHSLIVTPETVVRWHRTGFRMYCRLISRVRRQVGRRPAPKEVRELIFRMVVENPSWGAPRIHGELLILGFEVSERTISRWMKESAERSRPRQALASLPSQPSGSDCRHGFLHGANDYVRLFLRHQS